MKEEFSLPVEETMFLIDNYVEDSIRPYNMLSVSFFVKINYFF